MADFGDSLLQSDSILLDVNENLPNGENTLTIDPDKVNKIFPEKTEIVLENNITFNETLQSQRPQNCVEMPKDNCEVQKLDAHLLNDDATQGNLTVNELLNSSTTPVNVNEMPEIATEVQLNDFYPDVAEVNTKVPDSDSGIHDSENNIVGETDFFSVPNDLNVSNDFRNLISEFNSEECEIQVKDEEFHDAVQFFKDPSSFTFLENAGSTNAPEDPLITRSSLYINFDPLHAKFYSQSIKSKELHGIAEDDTCPEIPSKEDHAFPEKPSAEDNVFLKMLSVKDQMNPEMPNDNVQNDLVPNILNKQLAKVDVQESHENVLISFDSPVTSKPVKDDRPVEEKKLYTEEEFQQALKNKELSVQETFLKRQQELELTRSQKQQDTEAKLQEQTNLCKTFHCITTEIVDTAIAISEKKKLLEEKLAIVEKENSKLTEDLKNSVEDLQSVENTFSDFHKRYEQCKSMLKVYTQNEESLKQQLENMRVQLQEKDEMFKALQSRTQEMLDKANTEVANVKKAGDAQVAVLTAQLKKAELKISSLESDVKHVKIENGKLSSICDELMAKVSES